MIIVTEPEIIINGCMLTIGQAVTVRTALANFRFQLKQPSFAEAIGEDRARIHADRLSEIFHLITDAPT